MFLNRQTLCLQYFSIPHTTCSRKIQSTEHTSQICSTVQAPSLPRARPRKQVCPSHARWESNSPHGGEGESRAGGGSVLRGACLFRPFSLAPLAAAQPACTLSHSPGDSRKGDRIFHSKNNARLFSPLHNSAPHQLFFPDAVCYGDITVHATFFPGRVLLHCHCVQRH